MIDQSPTVFIDRDFTRPRTPVDFHSNHVMTPNLKAFTSFLGSKSKFFT